MIWVIVALILLVGVLTYWVLDGVTSYTEFLRGQLTLKEAKIEDLQSRLIAASEKPELAYPVVSKSKGVVRHISPAREAEIERGE